MSKWLKRWFVPHAENGHFPRFWRWGSVAAVLAVAILAVAARFAVPLFFSASSYLAAILPGVIVSLTNEERLAVALPAVTQNTLLDAAAQMKAEDMASRGYFAHVTPDGKEPWFWLDEAGYAYAHAGENLAVNFDDSDEVVEAWMDSPTHRANIVKEKYQEIGVGMAKGKYKGKSAVFVVQFFGTPKAQAAAAPSLAATPAPKPVAPAATTPAPELAKPATTAAASSTVAGVAFEAEEIAVAVVSSPRTTASYVLWTLFGLVALAFAIAIFVAIRIQFRAIILGGTLLLVALGALLWAERRDLPADRLLGEQPATSTETR
jgi:hypothetical protein